MTKTKTKTKTGKISYKNSPLDYFLFVYIHIPYNKDNYNWLIINQISIEQLIVSSQRGLNSSTR